MGLDFFGWALSFAAGGALLNWSFQDSYAIEICIDDARDDECYQAGDDLSATEKSGAILLLLTGYVVPLNPKLVLMLSRVTHLIMFIRACIAVHARRKQYVPSRNSFMQLEKGTDRLPQTLTPDSDASK